jgi:hypothetical protein
MVERSSFELARNVGGEDPATTTRISKEQQEFAFVLGNAMAENWNGKQSTTHLPANDTTFLGVANERSR